MPTEIDRVREFSDAQIRRFLTTLFVTRARRHIRSLAELYGWGPDKIAELEARFLHTASFVPVWI